jgi:hypothetical protein
VCPVPGLGRERIHVGDVGHPGQPDDRDPQAVGTVRRQRGMRPGVQVEGVLGVQPQIVPPREDAEDGTARHRLEHVQAGGEQPEVAAELVDDEPGDVPLIDRVEHGRCTASPNACSRRPTASSGTAPDPDTLAALRQAYLETQGDLEGR